MIQWISSFWADLTLTIRKYVFVKRVPSFIFSRDFFIVKIYVFLASKSNVIYLVFNPPKMYSSIVVLWKMDPNNWNMRHTRFWLGINEGCYFQRERENKQLVVPIIFISFWSQRSYLCMICFSCQRNWKLYRAYLFDFVYNMFLFDTI